MIWDKKFKVQISKTDGKYSWNAKYDSKLNMIEMISPRTDYRSYQFAKQSWNSTVKRLGLNQRNIIQ